MDALQPISDEDKAMERGILQTCLVAATITAMGCATQLTEADAENAVALRSRAYYEAIVAGDYKGAYEFFTPNYRGEFSVQAHYLARPPMVKISAARLVDVRCATPESCTVSTEIDYIDAGDARSPGRKTKLTNVVLGKWIRDQGQWWKHVE